MLIRTTDPMSLDAEPTEAKNEFYLKFYKTRKSVHGHMIEVLSDGGELLDRAILAINSKGKIKLESLFEEIVPEGDMVDEREPAANSQ